MEEKIVVRSKNTNAGLIRNVIIIIGIVVGLITFMLLSQNWKSYVEYAFRSTGAEVRDMSLIQFMFCEHNNSGNFFGLIIPVVLGIVIGFVVYYAIYKVELTVTDKRVYGIAAFGKRVDLPFDSISAVGTSILNSITVATSSGRITFAGVKNRDEIHKALSRLLIKRQSKPAPAVQTTIKQEIPQSNADELRKYKELLDLGVISQDEFDAKKKQLLGL